MSFINLGMEFGKISCDFWGSHESIQMGLVGEQRIDCTDSQQLE